MNSELGEDPVATFDEEPIVAYFNDPDCYNFAENDGEWVLNENVNFDYFLYFDDVHNLIYISSLHMPLLMLTTCMHVEDNEGSVFIVPSSKRNQSPIIFGKVRYQITTSNDSDEDLEPPQFFHYARPAHLIMKEMGFDLHRD